MSQNFRPLCPAVTITFVLSGPLQIPIEEHTSEPTSKTKKICIKAENTQDIHIFCYSMQAKM